MFTELLPNKKSVNKTKSIASQEAMFFVPPTTLTRATGCNIVVSLVIHFVILLIAPRAYCSLYHPQDALTIAHPSFLLKQKRGIGIALINKAKNERGNPPPFRPNYINTKTYHPKYRQHCDLSIEEWSPSLLA